MSNSNDPYLAVCPDYTLPIYAEPRQKLTQFGQTEAQAAAFLEQIWRAGNEKDKIQWRERVKAEAAASSRTKFLPVNQGLTLPDLPPRLPSAAVMATLRKGDYVPLYHFTNEALDALDESNELGLSLDDKSGLLPLTVRKSDADLNAYEFFEAATRMLELLVYAGWPEDRIQMYRDFWANIRSHRLWNTLDPDSDRKALLVYQFEQRRRWHMLCASTTNSTVIYNLAVINEKVLEQTRSVVDAQRMAEVRKKEEEAQRNMAQTYERNMEYHHRNQKRRRR